MLNEYAQSLERAFDAGETAFRKHPELNLAEVWWKAGYDSKEEQLAFCQGYRQARAQREAFERGE